jgi:CDGSH iron-sulfur domain-containing protein 3
MPSSWGEAKIRIQCVENGPYMVKGPVELKGDKGESIATTAVMSLCRCGGSKSKPFCDGTHSRIEFRSDKSRPA